MTDYSYMYLIFSENRQFQSSIKPFFPKKKNQRTFKECLVIIFGYLFFIFPIKHMLWILNRSVSAGTYNGYLQLAFFF